MIRVRVSLQNPLYCKTSLFNVLDYGISELRRCCCGVCFVDHNRVNYRAFLGRFIFNNKRPRIGISFKERFDDRFAHLGFVLFAPIERFVKIKHFKQCA